VVREQAFAAGHVRLGKRSPCRSALISFSSLLKNSYRSAMKEERELERGYSRIFLAGLPLATNQSCVARFRRSFFSKLSGTEAAARLAADRMNAHDAEQAH
jgi:hypothetical protein